jgi:D-alanyl-D-alanine carboxypeptidase
MLTNYKGDSSYLYDYCIGGKTGYTEVARYTLVTFAEKDDMTLICVVMREPDGNAQYSDTRTLLDYCFENFRTWNVSENVSEYQITGTASTEIFGQTTSFADLDKDSYIVLPQAAIFSDASYELKEETEVSDVAAVLEYTYAGRVVGSADIRATNTEVSTYPFHEVKEKSTGKRLFGGHVSRYVFLGIGVVAAVAVIGFVIFMLYNNFYLIRHKIQARRRNQGKFTRIKEGKHTKWKRK